MISRLKQGFPLKSLQKSDTSEGFLSIIAGAFYFIDRQKEIAGHLSAFLSSLPQFIFVRPFSKVLMIFYFVKTMNRNSPSSSVYQLSHSAHTFELINEDTKVILILEACKLGH